MAAHDDSGQLLRSTRPAAMAEEATAGGSLRKAGRRPQIARKSLKNSNCKSITYRERLESVNAVDVLPFVGNFDASIITVGVSH